MAVAIPLIAGIAAGAGAMALGAVAATAIAIGSVVAMGAALLTSPKQGMANPKTPQTYTSDPTTLTFQGDVPRRMVYGNPTVSGVVVYANTAGDDNELAILVVAIAAHEISGVDGIILDGKDGSAFGNKLKVEYMLGSDTQAANAYLVATIPQWTVNHRLQGIAYAAITLVHDKEVWSEGFPRNIQFKVRGKPVFDPRDSSTKWSCNAALNLYDYMRSRNGLSAQVADFSMPHLINALNKCDEVPPKNRGSVCSNRYPALGVIELTTSKEEVIQMFTTAMAGTLVWSEGKYQIFAGQTFPVVGEIKTEQLAGVPKITPQAARNKTFNTVKGVFLDASSGWTFTDFPPIVGANYVQEDGESLVHDISLPLTPDSLTAQRLATIFLRRQRLDGSIVIPCDWSCYGYQVMDVVHLSFDFLGWDKLAYQVSNWEFRLPTATDPGGVNLTLREYSDDIWSDDMDILPETGSGIIHKPDLNNIKAVKGLTLTSDLSTMDPMTQGPRVKAEWQQHANPYVNGYEVYYRLVGETEQNWIQVPSVGITSYMFPALSGRTYEFAIRAESITGTYSPESTASVVAWIGADIYPNDVDIFTATLTGAAGKPPEEQPNVRLDWSPVGNAVGYKIGFLTDSGVYTDIANVDSSVSSYLDSRKRVDGHYQIWAQGQSGQYSRNPAQVFVAASQVPITKVLEASGIWNFDWNGLVVYKGVKLVPQSQDLANVGGWDTFDQVVPNPVPECSITSKNQYASTGAPVYADGVVYYVDGNHGPNKVYPLVTDGSDWAKDLTKPTGTNLKVGTKYDTVKVLAIINGVDVFLGE